VKKKIYSIALLLSFLVVLSHQMISHHHGDSTLDNFSNAHNSIKEHSHHDDHGHHHHENGHQEDDSKKTNHSPTHSFPPHNHTVGSDDSDFVRLTPGPEISVKVISLIALSAGNLISSAKQSTTDKQKTFPDKPFPVNSIFQPGAIGLRAPPFVA
jgi:hypothetical protein